jgi:hypothetical protein
MDNVTDFVGVGIVGVVLSLVIEWAKTKFGTETNTTKAITIGLSVVVGLVYVYFRTTTWWTTILTILGVASTVYALVLKK